jgi:hypothetical protein
MFQHHVKPLKTRNPESHTKMSSDTGAGPRFDEPGRAKTLGRTAAARGELTSRVEWSMFSICSSLLVRVKSASSTTLMAGPANRRPPGSTDALRARLFRRAIVVTSLTAVTETNFNRLCLLPDHTLCSLYRFRDFDHRRSRLRIGFELPDVVLSPGSANGRLLFRHGSYSSLDGPRSVSS